MSCMTLFVKGFYSCQASGSSTPRSVPQVQDAWQHWATYDLPLRFDFGGSFFGLEARSEFNAGKEQP